MNKKDILNAIKNAREASKKRKFSQTFDLVVNLHKLNLKKPEENVNAFVVLPQGKGKKVKVCALVDKELGTQAKEVCDMVIMKDDFQKYKAKKDSKNLADDYDYFIAQANLMVDIAKFFGKVFGPKGKMPNPKSGCIVPPKIDLKIIYNKLQKTVKLQTKNEQAIKCSVGTEDMTDEQIQENILAIYNALVSVLPKEIQNIKNVMLKLTMGSPIIIGEQQKSEETKEEKPKAKKEEPKEEVKEENKKEKKEK
ncbi:MAG: 50S ribosomal protein L1 [Nanoarchaeota archaeon]|nr:50S ribosomal protein L1 [Nanoarchaeota archaeon]